MFGVVVVELVGNADALGKETRTVWKVEFAGQEAALLEDVGDVATRACVPGVDVDHLGCVGCGAGGRWRKSASGFLNETGNGEAVVLVEVICIGGVIPLDACELTKIRDVFVSETAVEEECGNVRVLWFVG